MKEAQRKCLEEKGWKVGTVSELLELFSEETAFIEIKLNISRLSQGRIEFATTQTKSAYAD